MSLGEYNESNSEERKRDMALLTKTLQDLGEHFDGVQIFAHRHVPGEGEGTRSCFKGIGNWFARYGQVREWVIYEDQRIRLAAQPPAE